MFQNHNDTKSHDATNCHDATYKSRCNFSKITKIITMLTKIDLKNPKRYHEFSFGDPNHDAKKRMSERLSPLELAVTSYKRR